MLRMVGSTGCSAASCDMVWYKPERAEVRALMGGASLFAQWGHGARTISRTYGDKEDSSAQSPVVSYEEGQEGERKEGFFPSPLIAVSWPLPVETGHHGRSLLEELVQTLTVSPNWKTKFNSWAKAVHSESQSFFKCSYSQKPQGFAFGLLPSFLFVCCV